MQPNFRDPVFVRSDDTTVIAASVVEWRGNDSGFSILFKGSEESVLINSRDWDAVKQCIDCELNRVGAFDVEAA